MLGFKVYYDKEEKEFVIDHNPSEVSDSTDLEMWFANLQTAVKGCININKKLKADISELKKDDDFIIQKCKDCGELHTLTKAHIDWFKNRDLKVPCRCDKCIKKRKESRKNKEVK